MTVTVTPEQFSYVYFDAAAIEDLIATLLERLGMSEQSVRIDVDESSPIVRIVAEDGDPLVLKVDSGAFEDARRPRHLSPDNTITNAGRVLLRRRDRVDGGFADAPADDDLTLAQVAAWDTYSVGRLARLGYEMHEPRWRYNFRNRHGFSDVADAVFDRLWRADTMTWGSLLAASDDARAAVAAS
jgi:hypothetical protein